MLCFKEQTFHWQGSRLNLLFWVCGAGSRVSAVVASHWIRATRMVYPFLLLFLGPCVFLLARGTALTHLELQARHQFLIVLLYVRTVVYEFI